MKSLTTSPKKGSLRFPQSLHPAPSPAFPRCPLLVLPSLTLTVLRLTCKVTNHQHTIFKGKKRGKKGTSSRYMNILREKQKEIWVETTVAFSQLSTKMWLFMTSTLSTSSCFLCL